MEPIKNILTSVDLTKSSMPLLRTSKNITEKLDAHLYVINILENEMVKTFEQIDSDLTDDLFKKSNEALENLIQEGGIDKIKHTSEVIPGIPFMEIITESTSLPPADLIILGGMTSRGVYYLGDNAFKVIRMAPYHTLALRSKAGDQNLDEISIKKILVALDFSEHSLMALDYALYFKPVFEAEIHILQVVSGGDEANEDEIKGKLQEHLSEDKFKEIDVIEVKASDTPAKEILKKLNESDIDLLAIGSHSKRRFLRNLFLGKVTYDVVRKTDCSVLVLKESPSQ